MIPCALPSSPSASCGYDPICLGILTLASPLLIRCRSSKTAPHIFGLRVILRFSPWLCSCSWRQTGGPRRPRGVGMYEHGAITGDLTDTCWHDVMPLLDDGIPQGRQGRRLGGHAGRQLKGTCLADSARTASSANRILSDYKNGFSAQEEATLRRLPSRIVSKGLKCYSKSSTELTEPR